MVQDGFGFKILLPQLPGCWDYRCTSPCSSSVTLSLSVLPRCHDFYWFSHYSDEENPGSLFHRNKGENVLTQGYWLPGLTAMLRIERISVTSWGALTSGVESKFFVLSGR